ncbi:hypothetical protein IAG25_10860 [Caballeronia sp. EK]|uniref:hypothetical protein n=1 Tax=Caballeronia sp. EK TaxID=2767469 RepID=UPI001656724F|nr:hypothetical protein [Caballeronia sp. EK]MBC8637312.1 hypothetical protein [Caballeronia sp. EK]
MHFVILAVAIGVLWLFYREKPRATALVVLVAVGVFCGFWLGMFAQVLIAPDINKAWPLWVGMLGCGALLPGLYYRATQKQ